MAHCPVGGGGGGGGGGEGSKSGVNKIHWKRCNFYHHCGITPYKPAYFKKGQQVGLVG